MGVEKAAETSKKLRDALAQHHNCHCGWGKASEISKGLANSVKTKGAHHE